MAREWLIESVSVFDGRYWVEGGSSVLPLRHARVRATTADLAMRRATRLVINNYRYAERRRRVCGVAVRLTLLPTPKPARDAKEK